MPLLLAIGIRCIIVHGVAPLGTIALGIHTTMLCRTTGVHVQFRMSSRCVLRRKSYQEHHFLNIVTFYKTMALNWAERLGAAATLAKSNPALAGAVALGTGGLALVAAPTVAVAPVLSVLPFVGFGAGGVIGGSSCTAIHCRSGKNTNVCGFRIDCRGRSSNNRKCSCSRFLRNIDKRWSWRLWGRGHNGGGSNSGWCNGGFGRRSRSLVGERSLKS